MKNRRHVFLTIGCPNGEDTHADFIYDQYKNKFICKHCKRDFTGEFREIYLKLGEQLKQ